MLVGTTLGDYYFEGDFHFGKLLFKAIYYPIVGFIIGLIAWWDNERKYQKSLKANLDVSARTK